jgi:uncharacterized coiled-coil protein SlyX
VAKKKTLNDVVMVLERMERRLDGRLAGIEEILGAHETRLDRHEAQLDTVIDELKGLQSQTGAISVGVTLVTRDYDARIRRLESAVFPDKH